MSVTRVIPCPHCRIGCAGGRDVVGARAACAGDAPDSQAAAAGRRRAAAHGGGRTHTAGCPPASALRARAHRRQDRRRRRVGDSAVAGLAPWRSEHFVIPPTRTSPSSLCRPTPMSWPRLLSSRRSRASSTRHRIRWRSSLTCRTTRSISISGAFSESAWSARGTSIRARTPRWSSRSSTRGWRTSIRARTARRPISPAPRSSLRTTSSGTTTRRWILTAMARTSPARSASAPGMASASRASRSTSRSCRSRWSAGRGTKPWARRMWARRAWWRSRFATPPTVARRSSTSVSGSTRTSPSVKDAILYAIDKGAFVAAAAGNSGDAGSPPFYPAAYAPSVQGLVAVGAVDFNFNRAYYSNSNDYVEIAAPGGDITADANHDGYGDGILQQTIDQQLASEGIFDQFGYFFFQGTSMSTPHVSGLAALLMNQGVTDPKAVEWAIEHFATDVGVPGRDNDTGFGVINPRNTLRGTWSEPMTRPVSIVASAAALWLVSASTGHRATGTDDFGWRRRADLDRPHHNRPRRRLAAQPEPTARDAPDRRRSRGHRQGRPVVSGAAAGEVRAARSRVRLRVRGSCSSRVRAAATESRTGHVDQRRRGNESPPRRQPRSFAFAATAPSLTSGSSPATASTPCSATGAGSSTAAAGK